jgi:hypothetical protein
LLPTVTRRERGIEKGQRNKALRTRLLLKQAKSMALNDGFIGKVGRIGQAMRCDSVYEKQANTGAVPYLSWHPRVSTRPVCAEGKMVVCYSGPGSDNMKRKAGRDKSGSVSNGGVDACRNPKHMVRLYLLHVRYQRCNHSPLQKLTTEVQRKRCGGSPMRNAKRLKNASIRGAPV